MMRNSIEKKYIEINTLFTIISSFSFLKRFYGLQRSYCLPTFLGGRIQTKFYSLHYTAYTWVECTLRVDYGIWSFRCSQRHYSF